ncbi:MAG: lysoplasmalogenase family protein [Clostridiales bacterium]|jgi:hypothetical protein|nr:lysoplasmalogenase family protein [Clostridiales bacterium]
MEYGIIKFSFIAICFLLVIFNYKDALSRRDFLFLLLGLGAALAADFFLVVVRFYTIGVSIFWFAHIFYALRFAGGKIWRVFPLALPIPLIYLLVGGDLLIAASLVYMGLFVISYAAMLKALKSKKYPTPNQILIFAGMTLFVLCDIFVAIFNMGLRGVFSSPALTYFAVDSIWLFYAPAKICLALSFLKFSQKTPCISPNPML